MKTILITLIFLLLLAGCDNTSPSSGNFVYQYGRYIPDDKKIEAAKFLNDLVKNANPHSDEEPEDNIAQAEITMLNIYGIRTIGLRNKYRRDSFIPYHKMAPAFQRECLKQMKIKDASQFELEKSK